MDSLSTADLFRVMFAAQVAIMAALLRPEDMETKVTVQEQLDLLVKLIHAK